MAAVAMSIGYIAGREHVKYELRQAVASVGESFAQDIGFRRGANTGSPERAWSEGDFIYAIPGGIEPGETQTWELDPGVETGLYMADEHPEAQLHISVVDLEWAN
jgi:hypothetical protein